MADAFLGLRMTVVLVNPPLTVAGLITEVIPHRLLVLENCHSLTPGNFGQQYSRLEIDPTNIQDICETRDELPIPLASPQELPAPQVPAGLSVATPPIAPPAAGAFQDPAILSMGKRPFIKPSHTSNIGEKRDPAPKPLAVPMQYTSSREGLTAGRGEGILGKENVLLARHVDTTAKVDSTEDDSFDATPTGVTGNGQDGGDPAPEQAGGAEAGRSKQPRRRRKPGNRQKNPDGEGGAASAAKPKPTDQAGAGWRNTPILQSTKSFQPFSSLKRSQKPNADNGWASEDVTDVQEAGDFDFEGNLTKFDKRTIFDEMRQQDHVDDADRLVSHNRLPRPKPGTAGGKNLHYTENVLEQPSNLAPPKLNETPDDFWKSEADDANLNGADRNSGKEGPGSGRTSRIREDSRMSATRRSQSRKASATTQVLADKQLPVPASAGADGFFAMPSNRRIETVTHLQMLNLENIAHNEIGFSEELIAENSGRSISEVALTALNDPAVVLRNATASPPNVNTIVILAGNHQLGARTIAAGRHLRNRGIEIAVCVVGIEREKELVDDVQRQIRLFRSFGGQVYSKTQLFKYLNNKTTATLTSSSQVPITLIIDSLLGLSISFEELRKSDQATTYELMEWANRNEAFVMAIDVPTGIDPTNGKVSVIDGAKLYVQPRYVVALGAPKQGLARAMEVGHNPERGDVTVDDWKIYLADIGLGATIWRKAATNLRLRRGIDFDDKWVLEMRYQYREDLSD